jgi:broad specificity phosphatase PhoE
VGTAVMSGGRFAGKRAEEGQIFIVRHAQSAANAGGRTTDPAIIPITNTGADRARSVADLVSERPRVIAVSRYLRTVQTAVPLLRRYPDVPVEQWRVEEFTYLDRTVCAGTTNAERKGLRDDYWKRRDPLWCGDGRFRQFPEVHFRAELRCPASLTKCEGASPVIGVCSLATSLWICEQNDAAKRDSCGATGNSASGRPAST